MPIQLEIRRLESRETLIAEFESLADAEAWLRERPANTTVVGAPGLDDATGARLRDVMRPLDEGERTKVAALEAEAAARRLARVEAEQEAALLELAAQREAAKDADPNRLMSVHWDRAAGYQNADPVDPREVPQIIMAAVESWVAERDTWVEARRQYVATADVNAWPGPLPSGQDERIVPGGQFTTLSGRPSD